MNKLGVARPFERENAEATGMNMERTKGDEDF